MVTRIKDLVRNEGKITTIEELDKKGLIEYREVKNFFGGKKVRTAYFADIKGTREGWEIGKMAFQSRTGELIALKGAFKMEEEEKAKEEETNKDKWLKEEVAKDNLVIGKNETEEIREEERFMRQTELWKKQYAPREKLLLATLDKKYQKIWHKKTIGAKTRIIDNLERDGHFQI